MSTLVAPQLQILAPKSPQTLLHFPPKPIKFLPKSSTRTNQSSSSSDDDGIPSDQVKTLAKFKSLHNQIQVLQVSRRANHPLAGSRLLLLDAPGNIHSISFLLQPLTSAYFDVFAALPPVLPPGPVAVLGFGAGSAARLLLTLYPDLVLHGWELDPAVVAVAREFFGLSKLEKQHPHRLFIHVQDAFEAEIAGGFAGILVDVFSKGSVVPQLQERGAWETLKGRLRRGGRVMVNCGGKCVEAEEDGRDGEAVMERTLEAMGRVWGAHQVFVLRLGRGKEDGNSSCVAFTGEMPDREAWKKALPRELRGYVDMWEPYRQRPPPL